MKSAVLFIIFKRPDTTKRVFERIREAQPPRLYIAADGPRMDRPDEVEKCNAARQIVENVDWPCEVHRLYRDENLGCGKGVSSAITWFFEHEEQGIIIEDDILPHIDFFKYCDEMLDRYKDDDRIHLISGFNFFYHGFEADSSYYMTNFGSIWGWASWRRVWNTYQFDVNAYPEKELKTKINNRLPWKTARYYYGVYDKMKQYKIDTWDFQFAMNRFYYDRYAITCYTNMVENIGMGGDSTHVTANSDISAHKAFSPFPLMHPNPIRYDIDADLETIKNGRIYISPWCIRWIRRLLRAPRKICAMLNA